MRPCPSEIGIWIHRLRKADGPPQCGWASSNPFRAWIEQKCKGRRNSPLFTSCLPVDLRHQSSPVLGLGFTSSVPLVLRTLVLDWNYTTGLPGSSVCRQQIMGLFSSHSCMSQFLIINLFLYKSYWFCFSGEPWLINSYIKICGKRENCSQCQKFFFLKLWNMVCSIIYSKSTNKFKL